MGTEKARTINGKPITDVLTALKQPFPYLVQDMGGYTAIDEEQVYNRLDSVCGLNWSFVMTMQPRLEKIAEKKHTIICAGFIEIRDDDGMLICRRGQAGGADVIITKTEPKDLSNDYKSAVTDCFKKCAKTLGIRPVLAPNGKTYKNSEEAAKDNYNSAYTNISEKSEDNKQTAAGKENPVGAENSEQKVETKACRFKVTKKGVRDNKKIKFEVVDTKGNTGELVFWNNVQNKIEPDTMQKINNAELGMVITAAFKEEAAYKGKRQFYVESVVEVA